jgi:hypothetical protein
MNRREFLFGWPLLAPQQSETLQVEVMEVFAASSGSSALLVHHADEATREDFSVWLRANSGAQVVCVLPNGTNVVARIFRVSLCFGRGLILLREPASVRAKDIWSIYRNK